MAAVTGERRKVVTIVFADVVGSTALGERVDSETLRWAMQRWFVRMRDVVESHGGTVENYIGDAVMAVFGIPVAHEDDALRAVRAAASMREQVQALGEELRRERGVELSVRMGVNTGEAVTGDAAAGGFFTAGDIVNVAARLEQAARPGDILVGGDTYRLVRHAVETEPVEPLVVKGKADPLAAFRLLAVAPDAVGRPQRVRAPMVGRSHERQRLIDAFEQAVGLRSCQLLTVLGGAGVGKSRLVAEVTAALGERATVAGGRCLPYGDGLTWWPLVEALGASGLFAQVADAAEPAIARAGELLKPEGEPVAPEEAFWAVRRVLETLARRQPLVLVVDDLHWAEPTFMDLLEHVADWVRDAPLLLLVMARPDLLDVRPAWGANRPNAASVLLEPLADAEAADLLNHLLGRPGSATAPRRASSRWPTATRSSSRRSSPCSRTTASSPWTGRGRASEPPAIAVPPTIQALLAARLDRLEPAERAVVEAASVEGKEFTRERVTALVGHGSGESTAPFCAGSCARTSSGRWDRMRRRTASATSSSATPPTRGCPRSCAPVCTSASPTGWSPARRPSRRSWTSSSATTWSAQCGCAASSARPTRRPPRSRRGRRHTSAQPACGPPSATIRQRRARCSSARWRSSGATTRRAAHCCQRSGRRSSRPVASPRRRASSTRRSSARPRPRLAARARIEREFVRLEAEAGVGTERARRVADEALSVLEREGDQPGQCRAWYLRAQAAWIAGRVGEADAAWCEAAVRARQAHDDRELFRILGMRATAAVLGPTPVDDAVRRCAGFRELVGASPVAAVLMLNPLASLHAMRGEFELADEFLSQANEALDQLGSMGWVSHHEALVRLLEGRPALAEIPLRSAVERLASMGDGELLATTLAMLAQAVFAQGQLEEAEQLCRMAASAGAADDIVTQVIWRGVAAKTLAHTGRFDEAERLARDGVKLVAPTDLLSHHGDAMLDLAEVLRTNSPHR